MKNENKPSKMLIIGKAQVKDDTILNMRMPLKPELTLVDEALKSL